MKSDLKKINAAGMHLLALISDVLDLSKIEAGKTDIEVTRIALKELVDEVVTTCTQLIEKNGNTLKLNCTGDIGMIRSDVTKVRQVLFNLLSNAAKFTKDGHIEVNVRRDVVAGDAVIVLEVSDSGIGITPEHAKTVFDAFNQVRSSTESGQPGTGLGLTITREYCRLLGGKLELSGTPGEGSVFTATLLADISAAPSVADHGDALVKVGFRLDRAENVLQGEYPLLARHFGDFKNLNRGLRRLARGIKDRLLHHP